MYTVVLKFATALSGRTQSPILNSIKRRLHKICYVEVYEGSNCAGRPKFSTTINRDLQNFGDLPSQLKVLGASSVILVPSPNNQVQCRRWTRQGPFSTRSGQTDIHRSSNKDHPEGFNVKNMFSGIFGGKDKTSSKLDKKQEEKLTQYREELNRLPEEQKKPYLDGFVQGLLSTKSSTIQTPVLKKSIMPRVLTVLIIAIIIAFWSGALRICVGDRPIGSLIFPTGDEVGPEELKVTFNDVRGCDEAKAEVVGSKRGSNSIHPLANQTTNQLLSEMDGFNQNEGTTLEVPEFAPYVLIGAGTASYYAALTIRARDPDAVVLILGDENENAYSRTSLSKELWWYGDENFAETLQYKSLMGRNKDVYFEVDGFYIPPAKWSKFPHGCVSLLKNARVEKINVADKSVVLKSGQKIRFNKCLIATGSRPTINKELDRSDLADRVHTLYNIKDFRKINSIISKSKDIAIIGGGFLASELAYSIKRRYHHVNELKIHQVFKEDDILEEALPVKICEDATKQLFKQGVNVLNKSSLFDASRTKDGRIRLMLRKEDGSKHEIIVDQIIDASGSQPNSEIAQKSGLEIDKENGGIIADSTMRARQDIFVAGDVSSFFDLKLGLRRRIEHADNAEITGRVAGENMTNGNRAYPRQASFTSTVGSNAYIIGVGRIDPKLKTIVVSAQKSPEFDDELRAVSFYVDKDTIVGVTMYNIFGDGLWVARKLIEDKASAKNATDLARLFRMYPMPKEEEDNADPKNA